jgi:hypothetical protein
MVVRLRVRQDRGRQDAVAVAWRVQFPFAAQPGDEPSNEQFMQLVRRGGGAASGPLHEVKKRRANPALADDADAEASEGGDFSCRR